MANLIVPTARYGLKITTASMAPYIRPGEIVCADADAPLARGVDAVLTLTDGRHAVRRLVSHRNGIWKFQGYGRACPSLKVRDRDVAAVHTVTAVVGVDGEVRS